MQNLVDFLPLVKGQKEISLVIAKDGKELDSFVQVVVNSAFSKAGDVFSLMTALKNGGHYYFVLTDKSVSDDKVFKDIYDFIVQYPPGSIQIFDQEKMESVVLSPNYEDISVIILLIQENLDLISKNGFSVLDKIGLTYRS